MAGAQNLIMSLWKVPDEETAEFMLAFYKALFNKKPVYDAFYEAQQLMKNKYREQPQKWAAWVLISG
jgi:CHAT domain-containing protein